MNLFNKEAWTIAQNTEENREKISALALAKECYSMTLDLLTNAEVVNDASKFEEQHKNKYKDNSAYNNSNSGADNNTSPSRSSEESNTTTSSDNNKESEEPTT
jgi:hypothetical protein